MASVLEIFALLVSQQSTFGMQASRYESRSGALSASELQGIGVTLELGEGATRLRNCNKWGLR